MLYCFAVNLSPVLVDITIIDINAAASTIVASVPNSGTDVV